MERDESWLRLGLADAVPEPPGSLAATRAVRAREAADRARRRRMNGLAVAAAGVLAVVTLVSGDVGGRDAVPAPADVTPAPTALDCPPMSFEDDPTAPLELAEGTVAARLCGVTGTPMRPPLDALTTDPDRLVRLVDSLQVDRRAPDERACTANAGQVFGLALQYPSGEVVTVRGDTGGCDWLSTADGDRFGASRVYRTYLRLLGDQRATTSPADVPRFELGCRDESGEAPVTDAPNVSPYDGRLPVELEHAVLCWSPVDSVQPVRRAEIPATDLETLLADLNAHTSTRSALDEEDYGVPGELRMDLVGQNAWGDVLTVWGQAGEFMVGDRYWLPSAASRRILDRLVEETDTPIPLPGPEASADLVVATWVELANAGDDRADSLWVDPADAPGVVQAEYKGAEVRRVSPPDGSAAAAYDEVAEHLAYYRADARLRPGQDYSEVRFTLVRDAGETWRILSMDVLGEVETGR